jgi:hypothetical protein
VSHFLVTRQLFLIIREVIVCMLFVEFYMPGAYLSPGFYGVEYSLDKMQSLNIEAPPMSLGRQLFYILVGSGLVVVVDTD